MDDLDVIIPVRNGAHLLSECLDSILAQVIEPERVIIVDDGSTDDTAKIASRYGVRLLRNYGAPGPYGARNFGVAHSDAELIVFFDMRSRARPGWLQMHRELLNRPGAALSATNVLVSSGPRLAQRVAGLQQPFRIELYVDGDRTPYFPTCNLGARRKAINEAGGFRVVRSGSDASLCWRIQDLDLGTFEYDRRVLVDWVPRDSLRGTFEQSFRFGSGRRDLARHVPVRAPAGHRPPSRLARARRKIDYVLETVSEARTRESDVAVLLLLRATFWIGVVVGAVRGTGAGAEAARRHREADPSHEGNHGRNTIK